MDTTFGNRLDKAITSYIDKKNQQIDLENEKIEKHNKEMKQKFKMQIQRASEKPLLKKTLKKYTQTQLIDDINEKYPINLTRQKLHQYINDEHMPNKETILALCDFFSIAYEYLCGNSNVANPSVARIQDFIGLNDTAIKTLMGIKDSTVLTVLNALLSDSTSFEYALLNMYEQAYQSYAQTNNPNSHGDYDMSIIHSDMEYAISFIRFIEDRLMPFVKKDFENRLQEQINFEEWRKENFKEYEHIKIPDNDLAD